ncbi:GDSL esterase/lipase At3g48460 [Selaginella moellendorffii]|uniref:GDSL esterase/lipase At3g48460 n=1 Tax=Selaginella moellendorffii TaxID=88036 RepID=UPI000D1CAFED|nr:GDSL esterase/lipase At3g48460 [Selaginella moellendorffii]|eukprot:XP_024535524.1 GDSL esterase/lipase At3g48460 [Selaginella moellendorffii]
MFALLLVLAASAASAAAGAASKLSNGSNLCFPAMFVFGDSYLDVGNKAALYPQVFQQPIPPVIISNEPPYGQTFFGHATGRFSDGRMISDFLAEALGFEDFPGAYFQPLASSFRYGANFALGGGTAIEHSFHESRNVTTVVPYSLLDELGWFLRFKKLARQQRQHKLAVTAFSEGLYVIGEIGSNDYTVGLFKGGMSPEVLNCTLLPLVRGSIKHFFEELHGSGARNFLFIGMPPAVDNPAYRSFGSFVNREKLYNLTAAHNAMLRKLVKDLKAKYTDSFLAFADFEGIHKDVMNNPGKHGFTDTSSACCGAEGPFNFNISIGCGQPGYTLCTTPAQFVFWDFSHYTEKFAQVATNAFVSGKYLHPPDAFTRKCGGKLKNLI